MGEALAYAKLLAAQVRGQASYRTSFAVDLAGNALSLGSDLLVVLVVFRVVPALGGFSVYEVLLMFGLTTASFSLADLAVGNVERLRHYVRTGLLDALLVRPLGALPQLLAMDFAPRRVGRVVSGSLMLAVAQRLAGIDWTPSRAVLLALALLTGAVLYGSVFVASASVAFWWVDSGQLGNALTYGGKDFSSYPITIYGGVFRRLVAYGLGFAFVAYYPVLALLGRADPLGRPGWLVWAGPAVAAAAAGAAALLWRTGVRHYRSTGS